MRIIKKSREFIIRNKWEFALFSIFLSYLIAIRIIIPIVRIPFLGVLDFDWDSYFRMSNDITLIFKKNIVAPFCFRPLVPLIAGLLPFNLETNYVLINFVAIYLAGIMLYYTLRLNFNRILSATGLFFFCFLNYIEMIYNPSSLSPFSPFYHIYFYEIYNVDTLALFLIIICFYCILKSKKMLYSIFLVFGILTKETLLFTIPVFIINLYLKSNFLLNRKEKFYNLTKNLIYIVPGIAIYIILHSLIIPRSIIGTVWQLYYQGNEYLSIDMIMLFVNLRISEIINGVGLFQWTIGTWGLILIFFISFNTTKELLKWIMLYGIFMLLVYSQMFLGIAVKKYIFYGFFPMIYLGISGLHCFNQGLRNYFNNGFLN